MDMVYEFLNNSAFIFNFTVFYPCLFLIFSEQQPTAEFLKNKKREQPVSRENACVCNMYYAWNAYGPLIGCTTSLDFS